jgi:membrane-associated protease RseP (regulator of RpoE activity)
MTPLIRRVDEQDVLIVLPEMVLPAAPAETPTGRPWVNLALFVATVFSVLLAGMQQSTGNFIADLFSGWPFAAGLLVTLLTHEFGHYFAAQYHGVPASLPYFIPWPLPPLGTFGAVITIKARMQDRRSLLDIGAAGPLAGLIVALPVLFVGLALSSVEPLAGQCTAEQPCLLEGNSLLYLGAKFLIHGRVLPGDGLDVMLHPLAFAGWAGILVTMFNLLPVGTLDGGHIAYALLGEKARYLFYPILVALLVLGINWEGWWLWAAMLFVFGRRRARPVDDATPLDGKRKVIAVIAMVVFVLIFTPLPMTLIP